MSGNLKRLVAIYLVLILLSADVCAFAEALATRFGLSMKRHFGEILPSEK